MYIRYQIGNPSIKTESVVQKLEVTDGKMPGWGYNRQQRSMSYCLGEKDLVYGLGETVRGMNKRGWRYISNNADETFHEEEKNSLYSSHNFFVIISAGKSIGIYVDTPGVVEFDIGYTKLNQIILRFEEFDADLYYKEGRSPQEVIREFRELTGRSYIPPRWAFGYGQSRFSYMDEDEIRTLIKSYKKAGFPIDSVYLDIDYMEEYKDFTVNKERFPNFSDFVNEMQEEHIHLVPIIDAGVKKDENYEVCREGVEKDYFCRKENGEYLVGAVWPGKAYFPDFMKPEVRELFGNWYQVLLEQGIDGFWNDMNEPAIFYTEDHLKEVFEKIHEYENQNLDINTFFEFKALLDSIALSTDDFKRFYHEVNGKMIRHDKVHNLYGYNMTRAAGEAFERLVPDRRILMFSRSSFVGMHRYGGVWTGDNRSRWGHILLNLQQLTGLNMCGFLYCGADVGGFRADATEDLLLRWTELGMFTPLFRNHSAKGTRRQEFYRYEHVQDFRNLVALRYALIPYLYSEFMKAALENDMNFIPLAFAYPDDERAVHVEDQILVGESIMIAPIYKQNAIGRFVYLPEKMKLLRFRSADDYDEEILEKGDHFVKADLQEVLVFLRPGHVLPLAEGKLESTDDIDIEKMKYITFEAEQEQYQLYWDDGISVIK